MKIPRKKMMDPRDTHEKIFRPDKTPTKYQ